MYISIIYIKVIYIIFSIYNLNTSEVSINSGTWKKYTKSKSELHIPTGYGRVDSE